jgi:hypothetical protein
MVPGAILLCESVNSDRGSKKKQELESSNMSGSIHVSRAVSRETPQRSYSFGQFFFTARTRFRVTVSYAADPLDSNEIAWRRLSTVATS